MANDPAQAVLDIFSQIINQVKSSVPMRSDDKPLKGGSVYSMMTLGMPVNPVDFVNPWNPQGAATVLPPSPSAAPAPAVTPATAAAANPAPVAPDPEAARALAAAFKTSALCNMLLRVTDDQTYQQYPVGQDLSVQYDSITTAMQPVSANEADDPKVVAALAKANKVLFLPNADGTPSANATPMYQAYQDNSYAYGQAVGAFADAYAAARMDPSQMQIWPIRSKPLQMAVTKAKHDLIASGAPTIEQALDAIASVGNPYQAHMVAQAKSSFKDWNLQLAGAVPASSEYCYILPSDWASDDPHACKGWSTIQSTSSSYQHFDASHAQSQSQFSWINKQSSIGGGASASYLGFSVGGSAGHSSSSQSSQASNSASAIATQSTHIKGLNITMSYALCTVMRPWFVGDLFYMKDWYLKGSKKHSISTGNIKDQLGDESMLPMIPQRMLVVRNVQITASDWAGFDTHLTSAYGKNQQSSSSSADNQAAKAGFSLGFISFGGSVAHSSSQAQGQGSSFQQADSSGYMGTTFSQGKLTIPGAQILGWLCDIVPASAPVDDPMYGKTAPAPAPAAKQDVQVGDPVAAN